MEFFGLTKFNESTLPASFVGIAVQVENKIPTHAGILVRLNNVNYLVHFPGKVPPEIIQDFNDDGWGVYKIFNEINIDSTEEVDSFLSYCKRVCSSSEITYSFFADGSRLDSTTGKYISKSGLPELGSCVGFCLPILSNSVLSGDEFLKIDDWSDTKVPQELEHFDKWAEFQVKMKHPLIDMDLYRSLKKRISPLEYIAAGYFFDYPISKSQIDNIINKVDFEIKSKF